MLTLIKRALAAAIVSAAMAAPVAGAARPIQDPISSAPLPVAPPYSVAADQPAATSSAFQWGDAGIGAGTLLVLVSLGAGSAVVYRRRAQRPLAS